MTFKIILFHHIQSTFSSPMRLSGILLIAVMIITSVILGVGDYKQRTLLEADWKHNQDKMFSGSSNLYVAQNNYYTIDSIPLSYVFSKGIYSQSPGSVLIPNDRFRYLNHYNSLDLDFNYFLSSLGKFDYTHVIAYFVVLLSMLNGYSSVCGDKERGTLKLIMSHSISRSVYLFAKISGGLVSLLLTYLVSMVFACAYCVFTLETGLFELLPFLIFLSVFSIGLITTYYLLSVAVSTLVYSSKLSLIVCISIWLIFQIVPTIIDSIVVETVYKDPPLNRVNNDIMSLISEKNSKTINRMTSRANELLDQGASWEEAQKRAIDEVIMKTEEETKNQIYSNLNSFYNGLDMVYSSQIKLDMLTPASLFVKTANDLSGTGNVHLLRRNEYIREFSVQLRSYVEDKVNEARMKPRRRVSSMRYNNTTGRFEAVKGEKMDLSDAPEFSSNNKMIHYPEETIVYLLSSYLFWCVLSLAISWKNILSYDLR